MEIIINEDGASIQNGNIIAEVSADGHIRFLTADSRVEVLAEGADVINVNVYARAVKKVWAVWAEGAEVSRAEV